MRRAGDLEVAVLGAGPHGLSAAVHLRRAGVQAHVFGEPMAFWRSMPRGMLLRSNLSASNLIEPRGPLSLRAFGAERGAPVEAPVPLDDFIAYGDWVQQHALPDLDRRQVTHLRADGGGFALTLHDGETVAARAVVLACGIAPFRRLPAGFDHLPDQLVSHAADHRDLDRFREQAVTIVGGGQSAFELAALIAEAGAASVEVLARAEQIVWLRGHSVKRALGRLGPVLYAPTDVGPLWYSRLVERPALLGLVPRARRDRIAARCIRPACSHFVRVRLGPVRITTGVSVRRARVQGEGLVLDLSDGTARQTDHAVLATGYEVDFARYSFLDPAVRGAVAMAGGFPLLGRGLETSLPGLHVSGAPAAWSFGPIMRFVSGSWYAGTAIARSLASARARRRAP